MIARTLKRVVASSAPAAPLGIARVMAGSAALLQLSLTPAVYERYADPARVHFPNVSWVPGPTAETAPLILGAWLAAGACFTVGWLTRWAGGLLAAILLWSVLYDEQTYDNHVYLLSLVTFLLTLANAGSALSIDARLRGAQTTVPGWPVFLLKAQLSVVYGFAALNKLNTHFLTGEVMVRNVTGVSALEGVIGWRPTFALHLASAWATVLIEAWLAVAMWSRKWRPSAIALGFLLHAGINTMMGQYVGLGVFTLAMWALYLPFLDAYPASRAVVWRNDSSARVTWVRWLRRLDWLRVHEFQESRAPAVPATLGDGAAEPIQLLGPGERHAGFAAVGRILELQPLSFLWAPFLRLLAVRNIGDRLLRRSLGSDAASGRRAAGAPADPA